MLLRLFYDIVENIFGEDLNVKIKICLLALAASILLTTAALAAGTVELNVPGDYATIQAAIDAAADLASRNTGTIYAVFVEPGTYAGGIELRTGIPVEGRETARTILTGGDPAVTVDSVTNVSFRKFTIINTTRGMLISNSSSVDVTNNVFFAGTGSTGLRVANSPTNVTIVNNVFYQNGTAIERDADVVIKNNIFSTNTNAISAPGLASALISFNDFFGNTSDGPTGSNAVTVATPAPSGGVDPLFADPGNLDFHARQNSPQSPCIDAGDPNIKDRADNTTSDIGAYGGPHMDTIPFPVTISSAVASGTSAIAISWQPSKSYLIANPAKRGSYNIYYKFGAAGPPYTTKINMASAVTSTVISGLAGTTAPPASPILNTPEYADGSLILSWLPASNAAGYKVYFFDSITGVQNVIDVGNTVFYILSGLVNGREYGITVSAYSQATYHLAVTAVDNTGQVSIPGVEHESGYSSPKIVYIGDAVEGVRSSPTQTAYPDAIVAGPGLPDNGCFIATAAYGYYTAPQVQVLRTFRDRYLMTNNPGKAFVARYYRYGPIGADFLNAHPWLKPAARIVLLPLVGGAWFLTETAMPGKIIAAFAAGMIMFVIMKRKKLSRSGGVP